MNENAHHIDASQVREAAKHHWRGILTALAPSLSEAIERHPRHVGCPVHGGKNGLRLFRDFEETGGLICNSCGAHSDGFGALMFVNGWSFPEALKAVHEALGGVSTPVPVPTPAQAKKQKQEDQAKAKARKKALQRAYEQSEALDLGKHLPVTNYLRMRGFGALMEQGQTVANDLRFSPSLRYYAEDEEGGKVELSFPALLGVVRNGKGEAVTLHRTYLTSEGRKAPVESAKKLMSPVVRGATLGAAVRLFEPAAGETLAVTEGIETALAVRCATGHGVWAALTANSLAAMDIPECYRHITIYGDRDASGVGQEAANTLAKRMREQGRTVVVHLPKRDDEDFADIYLAKLRRSMAA